MEQQTQKSPLAVTQEVEIIKFIAGEPEYQPDMVAAEIAVELFVDGILLKTLYATPNHLQEMVVGYLLARGKIGCYGDIASMRMVPKSCSNGQFAYQAQVELEYSGEAVSRGLVKPIYPLADVAKADMMAYLADFGLDILGVNRVMQEFVDRSTVFKATGAVHSCGLAHGGDLLFFTEDVARYNAFNKAMGYFAMAGDKEPWPQEKQRYLLVSGRVSGEMVEQCATLGVPLIISKSAPLSRAVALAKQYKVGLLGFVRGESFNVYNL